MGLVAPRESEVQHRDHERLEVVLVGDLPLAGHGAIGDLEEPLVLESHRIAVCLPPAAAHLFGNRAKTRVGVTFNGGGPPEVVQVDDEHRLLIGDAEVAVVVEEGLGDLRVEPEIFDQRIAPHLDDEDAVLAGVCSVRSHKCRPWP